MFKKFDPRYFEDPKAFITQREETYTSQLAGRVVVPTKEEFGRDLRMLFGRALTHEERDMYAALFLISVALGHDGIRVGINEVIVEAYTEVLREMLTVITYLHVHRLNLVDLVDPSRIESVRQAVCDFYHGGA